MSKARQASKKVRRRLRDRSECPTPTEVLKRARKRTQSPVGTPKERRLAKLLGIKRECPVCRSTRPCKCREDDRAFVRRTRFEEGVKRVGRCQRCRAPLSVVYVPRPGAKPPHRLVQFTAVYACSLCNGDSIAGVVYGLMGLKQGR